MEGLEGPRALCWPEPKLVKDVKEELPAWLKERVLVCPGPRFLNVEEDSCLSTTLTGEPWFAKVCNEGEEFRILSCCLETGLSKVCPEGKEPRILC